MVLESITDPEKAEKYPYITLLLGIAYGTIAIFLSNWIFQEQSSMVMVFLTVMAILPLMYNTLKYEEQKDLDIDDKKSIWHNHGDALYFYLMIFIGMSIAFTFWYIALPADMSANTFKIQTQTISNLNQHVTGQVTETTLMSKIFLNNIKVLIFCILFSFLYGSGAIFILAWNASVIGAAAGNFIRTHIAQFSNAEGLHMVGAYFYVSSLSVLRYAIHGIPEIFAYVVAGLAGGILSFAIVKQHYSTNKFEKVLLDVSDLVLIAVFILAIAAVIEVYITPALF